MAKHRDLAYNDRLPEAVTDALMELLSGGLFNFRITQISGTAIRVPAGTDDDEVGAVIDGKWRYNTANADASHPGGAAALFDVFITAGPNNFVPSGNPPGMTPENDLTVYTFGLTIKVQGVTPSGTGAETHYRKVAVLKWNGTAIVDIDRTLIGQPDTTKFGSTIVFNGPETNLPIGYVPEDGRILAQASFPSAYAAIGDTHNTTNGQAAPGAGNFRVPDKRGRVQVGKDNQGGATASRITTASAGFDGTALGAAGGAQTVTLTLAQIPSHNHGGGSHSHTVNSHSHGGATGGAVDHYYFDVVTWTDYTGFNVGMTFSGGADFWLFKGFESYGGQGHAHTIPAEAPGTSGPSTTVVVSEGGGGAHLNVQPSIIVNTAIRVS